MSFPIFILSLGLLASVSIRPYLSSLYCRGLFSVTLVVLTSFFMSRSWGPYFLFHQACRPWTVRGWVTCRWSTSSIRQLYVLLSFSLTNTVLPITILLTSPLALLYYSFYTNLRKLSRNIFDFCLQAITMDVLYAEVAELADALGWGPSPRKGVGVRIPPSAFTNFFHSKYLPFCITTEALYPDIFPWYHNLEYLREKRRILPATIFRKSK